MSNSLYLKNLAGIRALAALLVVFHLLEQYKAKFGWGILWSNSFVRELGGNAVSIFFVLSGFLISYLLLAEKRKTGDVQLKKFYFRRILRIWPLYFLVLILGILANVYFFTWSSISGDLSYFILFIANVLLAQGIAVPFIAHFWSVCVEECSLP